MIELPEAIVIAQEINDALSGKRITRVVASQNPHKFAWFYKDPQDYHDLLFNKTIRKTFNQSGFIRIELDDDIIMLFSEGIRIRYFMEGARLPEKHQLLVEFGDHTYLVCTVQMYGALLAMHDGDWDNDYYSAARKKPSPLTDNFDQKYFNRLINESNEKLTLKGFLATEQRIPGLGNGVLQDILFNARLHPRKKINSLTEGEKIRLLHSLKSTLLNMIMEGGRDTELDIFGYTGGYQTILSKNTVDNPCPICGSLIQKQAYMGGSIYFCPTCQKM